jgi:hypothetical protein
VFAALVAAAAVPAGGAAAPSISAADRAAVNRTLSVFVPAVIGRDHAERAWSLTTASMHQGSTRAEWRQGLVPVQPYPVVAGDHSGWRIDEAHPGRLSIALLVHLKKGNPLKLSAVSFDVDMKKQGARWLVDSAVTAATFAAAGTPSKILAANDYGPGNTPDPYAENEGYHSVIGATWIYVIPALLLVLVVLVPATILVVHRRRDRARMADGREEIRKRVFRTSA